MELQINEGLIRVIILDVDNLYAQIYDELYCSKEKYNEIISEFSDSARYKIIIV